QASTRTHTITHLLSLIKMSDCAGCYEPLPETGEFATCSICKSQLHFQCADILESTWNMMGVTKRENWKCSKCCLSKAKGSKEVAGVDKLRAEFLPKMEETIKTQFLQYEKNFGKEVVGVPPATNIDSLSLQDNQADIVQFFLLLLLSSFRLTYLQYNP
ncbi:hypothetical protein J6590_106831, partial [Homalodisca vitripennis]